MSFAAAVSRLKRRSVKWIGIVAGSVLAAAPVAAQGTVTLPLEARSKGSAAAPVTVYEMADFQCPFCSRFFRETFATLDAEFVKTGKVRWIFVNYPIASLHANAEAAAEFAVCAGSLGKFWPTHDMLYSTQEQWEKLKNPVPFFQSRIGALGIKADAMTSCLQSGRGNAMVQDDLGGVKKSGAQSTPSFYIEGGILEGAQPLEVFRHILDSVYKVKTKKS